MRIRAAVVSVLFVVVVGCCCGSVLADEDPQAKALAAMQACDYERAAKLLEKHLEKNPGDPRAVYNLACCHSRLGDVAQAAELVEAAWTAGLRDLELLHTDPDLEALRASRRGLRLVDRLEAEEAQRQRMRGRPLLFDATVVAGARVVTPDELEPGHRVPLVVALHGNGGSAERMAGIFLAAELTPDFVVCAPYGPYPIPQRDGLGYSWYPPVWLFNESVARLADPGKTARERALELQVHEQEVSERYVLDAIEAAKRDSLVDPDRVYLLGFSQGGVLAYGLALGHPEIFRGLVAIGTLMREPQVDEERLAGAAGRLQVLVCHSPEDQGAAFSEAEAAHRRLTAAGIDSRLVRYQGGHALTAELLRTVADWIDTTAEE